MYIPKGGIGVFDSGIGGLTVLAACAQNLKDEIFYYYGDNRHAPYGNLKTKTIKRYVEKVFKRFARLKVKAVVIGCNTATAVCVEELRKRYSFPIIGAEPAIFSAAKDGGEVWALATKATCNSERFNNLIKKASEKFPNAKIVPKACPTLAGAIEKNLLQNAFDYTPFLPKGKPDSVVLGCTHYIYIKEQIKQWYNCKVYDGNIGIVNRLKFVCEESKSSKNRDERPLEPNIISDSEKFGKSINISKRQQTKKSFFGKIKKLPSHEEDPSVFFISRTKKVNKTVYKQMFA